MGRQAGEKLWVRGVNPMDFQNRTKENVSFIHFGHGPPTVTRLLVDDVDKKLSLSFSVLKLEQLVQLHSPSRPSAGERMQPHHATRVDNGAGKARRRVIDDVILQ
jgi:hypothetical protein